MEKMPTEKEGAEKKRRDSQTKGKEDEEEDRGEA